MSVPFSGKFQLLNVILDQFVDCKFIIHDYRRLTVHKLVKNCIQKFFLLHFYGLPLMPPPTYCIFINCRQHPWWPKLKKEAMAASTGEAWSKKLTISAKFKLSNVILDQLMDCYVSIVMHYDIAIQ